MRGHRQPAFFTAIPGILLYAVFFTRIRRAHFSWDANILALFGLPLFSYLLLRSKIFHQRGRVSWKGRNYSGKVTSEERELSAPSQHALTGN